MIHYSLAAADAPLATLVEFAGQRLENKLDANNATTSGATFRLLRLGHVTLPKEIHGEVLRLQAGDKESTALQIRQVVITRTRASD